MLVPAEPMVELRPRLMDQLMPRSIVHLLGLPLLLLLMIVLTPLCCLSC